MLDRPFKSNPKFSVAFGVGIGSSNMFFDNTRVDIKSPTTRLPFTAVDSVDHFKKFKVTNIYAEVPVELRYYSNPANTNRSWKAALGVKVGTLLKTYTKGKDLVTKSGSSVYGPGYVVKESNKRFFNGTMLALTGRIGYGVFGIFGTYQVNDFFKEGVGPNVRPYSIGLSISGL